MTATQAHRRYNTSAKGRARNARYEATPKARARKLFYEQTVRAVRRAPGGVTVAGVRRDGRPKYALDGCYRVTYTSPLDVGVTAPSQELVSFEQRMRPDESAARADYARVVRSEREAGVTSPATLVELAASRD